MSRKKQKPESLGSRNRIDVKHRGGADVPNSARTGIITSIPVTTDWEAVGDYFASRTGYAFARRQDEGGGVD